MHRNKINNKVYIGITKKRPYDRWGKNGQCYITGYFKSAIHKYGWDNFEHIIIANGLTKYEACAMEIDLIKKYQSNNAHYGYNLSAGGESGTNGYVSESAIKKRSKPVLQYSLDGRFIARYPSIKEACEKNDGCIATHISDVCNFKRTYCGDYTWRYENEEFKELEDIDVHIYKPKKDKVAQYSQNNELIAIFNNASEASKKYGKHISECLSGKRKTASGYKWKYI